MELSPDHSRLWVANIADATVSVILLSNITLEEELGAALGPVTIRNRPGTDEMWVVCQSSGTVLIFDAVTRKLLDSVTPGPNSPFTTFPLGGEPSGLVFDAAGAKAYVTLSGPNQVAEIDTATRVVARRFEVGSNFPPGSSNFSHVEEPRSLCLVGNNLFVLSLESGNGTIPKPAGGGGALKSVIVDMWNDFPSLTPDPPPDRDAIVFDVSQPTPAGAIGLWRMGTLDFDIASRPQAASTTLYVSNVDMHNTLLGEHQFSQPGQGIASHRITYARPWSGGTIPQPKATIDLETNRHASLSSEHFAVPNEMAFNAAGTLLYVACYESKNTAVIDATTDTVIASLHSSSAGPRGVVLDEANGHLFVYNRADQTVDLFLVPVAAGTIVSTPARTIAAGYDGEPLSIKNGRMHHIDAGNSSNHLQSCNTCHMDGHFDRIAWDLGQFTGPLPPPSGAPEPKDAKGVKVTMSLRGIEETAPFHWRGDREDLKDFNPAFFGLLGGAPLSDPEFAEFQDFVFALSYPPNPGQVLTRVLSSSASAGKTLFLTKQDAFTVRIDNLGTQAQMNCAQCHSLDGFSGTNNQINNDLNVLFADDATQLRGMFDKKSDEITFGSTYVGTLNSACYGFANAGLFRTLESFVSAFNLTVQQQADVVRFLEEFDSGSAPVISWTFTLTQAKAGAPTTSPVPRYLLAQRAAGNCDAVARGWTVNGSGVRVPLRMFFDPSVSGGMWVTDHTGFGPYTYANLDAIALAGNGVFAFFGVPVGSGLRLGLDRDLDFLPDGDEAALNALSNNTDTDGDGRPDGYEIAHGSLPNDPNSVPTNDSTPPTISFTGGTPVVWTNSRIAKLRWSTNEESITKVRVHATSGPVAYDQTFERPQFDREHVIRVRGLRPGHVYEVELFARDPSNNSTSLPPIAGAINTQAHVFQSVHADNVLLTPGPINMTTLQVLTSVDVTVFDEDVLPVAGATVTGKFVEWLGTGAAIVTPFTVSPTAGNGKVTASYLTSNIVGSGAHVEAIVTSVNDVNGNQLHFHPFEKTFASKISL
jgi:YVTN family beta-propeller protein